MKKQTKGLLAVFIILGLLFLNYPLKSYKVEIDKKRVMQEEVAEETRDVTENYDYGPFGEVRVNLGIDKRGEDENFLSGVRFKLSTYNNIYDFTSRQDGPVYYFSDHIEGEEEFQETYKILSKEQKNVVDSITMTKDFNKLNQGNYIDCYSYFEKQDEDSPSERRTDAEAQYRIENGSICMIPLPTVFYLEETKAPTGYVREKVITPGALTLAYYVSGAPSSDMKKREDSTVYFRVSDVFGGNNYPVELVGIQVGTWYEPYYMEYGSVDIKDLVGVDVDKAWDLWESEGIAGKECNYVTLTGNGILENSKSIKAMDVEEEKFDDRICGTIYLVNQKGEVNLELNSYVNNKDSVKTTVNSNLQYRVVVKNTGSVDAIDSVVTSKLPEGFVYVEGSASNDGEYANGTVQWRVDRVKSGKEVELTYQAYAPNGVDTSKTYIGEASATNFAMTNKVEGNKTTVKLSMLNPETLAPIGMIVLIVILVGTIGVILLKRQSTKKKQSQEI